MRIGIFDSGLGGLAVAQAIIQRLPQYDYVYLGDTKRVPYGGRSMDAIHGFVSEGLDFLLAQDCHLVILACNTASAESLRKSQQEYLPGRYPERRVLGVIIPCVEAACASGATSVGILATRSTVASGSYLREFQLQCPTVEVVQSAAPLLVPLIEGDGLRHLEPILEEYLDPLKDLDCLILGCTHYSVIKDQIRQRFKGTVVSSDEIVPDRLADYLDRHPEHESRLSRLGTRRYFVTDIAPGYEDLVQTLVGRSLTLKAVSI